MTAPNQAFCGRYQTQAEWAKKRAQIVRDTAAALQVPVGEIVVAEIEEKAGVQLLAYWVPEHRLVS